MGLFVNASNQNPELILIDPYKFNAEKVRASIKRVSMIAPKITSPPLVTQGVDIKERGDEPSMDH